MHKFVSFNHQIIPTENSFLPVASSAAFYGKGVFSTVAVYHGIPFLWEKHWRRLKTDAKKIGVCLSKFSEVDVKNSLLETIEQNDFQTGRARITFFEEDLSGVWNFKSKSETSLLIATANLRGAKNDFSLTVSPFRLNSRSPLAGVKSCNYLENLLKLEDARSKGFDEAVCLNERDEIVSASTANIFWVKDGQIFTPSLQTGCLAGTMRGFVSENFAVCEKQAGIDELLEADEVFLTSSGIGVKKVKNLDSKYFQSFKTAEAVQRFLKKFIRKSEGR